MPTTGPGRGVALLDVVHADVPPAARGGVHDLDLRRFPQEVAYVPRFGRQLFAAARDRRSSRGPCAAPDRPRTRVRHVLPSKPPPPMRNVTYLRWIWNTGEVSGADRAVPAVVGASPGPVPGVAGDLHLPRQCPLGRTGAEGGPGRRPAAVVLALEVREDDVGPVREGRTERGKTQARLSPPSRSFSVLPFIVVSCAGEHPRLGCSRSNH